MYMYIYDRYAYVQIWFWRCELFPQPNVSVEWILYIYEYAYINLVIENNRFTTHWSITTRRTMIAKGSA